MLISGRKSAALRKSLGTKWFDSPEAVVSVRRKRGTRPRQWFDPGAKLPAMSRRWPLALVGLFLSTFALLALSGPGRIDIIDGQARYEVARSLVEHGDTIIRDPNVWYPVLPGRDGNLYTPYRIPHSLFGVPAIWLADATGPVSEGRRHFFFALVSAAAGAFLAVVYALWFRGHGQTPAAALAWAAAGIFCTPNWYYSTSTFDEIFGTASVVFALYAAWLSRERSSIARSSLSGISLGLAINFKQPLGIFILPALAFAYDGRHSWRGQVARLAPILAGLAIGGVLYRAYEMWQYPDGVHAEGMQFRPPVWGHAPFTALVALIASPSCGMLWYCPTLFLSLGGTRVAWNADRPGTAAVVLSTAIFTGFIALLGFFKGDIGWGPRYLTPVFALLWLFTPHVATFMSRGRIAMLLSLGLAVQLLALGHDPHRCYIRTGLKPIYQFVTPSFFYDLRSSHLLQRPREVWESLTETRSAEQFTPAPSPTYALPLPDTMVDDPDAVWRFQVFNQLRPWWAYQWYLPTNERPVDLGITLGFMTLLLMCGGLLTVFGLRERGVVVNSGSIGAMDDFVTSR
jgi:hypothetical protein